MRLISVAILCLFATLSAAQPADDSVQTPTTIQPTHRLSFPDSPDIGSVAFSPDGKVMYVHLRPGAVDVWEMLVYVWPEGLGALVGIAAVATGLVAWRVRRRPQRKGVLYCRKCNYDLSGLATGNGGPARMCPECGIDLGVKKPRTGRGGWRRLGPMLAALVIVAGGYSAMWAAELPRAGRASGWFAWQSTFLFQAAQSRGITRLSSFESGVDRVVAVDTGTGQVLRTVCTRADSTWFPIKLLPDGSGLFLADGQNGLVLLNTADGRVRAKLDTGVPDEFGTPDSDTIVGFADGGRLAYCVGTSQDQQKTRVYEWNLKAGTSRVVHETGASGYGPRRVLMLPGEPGPRFVVAPDFMEAYHNKDYTLRFVGPGVESRASIRMPNITSPSADPVVTPDGMRLFASAMSRGIVGVDLATGESLGVLSPGYRDSPLDELALSPDGDLLFVSVSDSILVRRISSRAWVARLAYPPLFIAPKLFVSPDGLWLAAMPFRSVGGNSSGAFVHEVFLYDLAVILQPPTPGVN